MPIIKCKMCGGDLRIEEGSTVCECEYCGTRQTVPSADNEKKLTLFSRAGRLLRGCEFDKAAGVFEAIVADFPEEAEAYWGLVLCKYGIEYVDDPATGKKIPTCHRSSFESVLDDPNFEQACENTDALARRVYRDEARQIEDLRKRIIEVSGKEEPYDVFISYKETDENGDRTLDSVIAQDIYTELTEKGYRVFFSRISLEDKLGTEYEPYIFAALNSAKVMLVVGTDYENFDAVWVKNEWSRFLKLIASGQKKTLIPVFKNMDAYDMPKEFAKLAAQDMGKVGAMQDLVRGVEKLVRKKTAPSPVQQPQQVIVQQSGGPNTVALLKRGQQALEDCNWDKAREFFDRVLDIDAENSDAFFGLFLAGAKCINEENYINKVCTKNSQTEMLKLSPATERIEKIVKQYTVKDYLSENEIRALFQYDLNYPSSMKAKKTLAAEEKQVFEKDRNLARAISYSKNEEKTRALQFKTRLCAELDAGIKKARNQEAEVRTKKQEDYENFLTRAENTAYGLYCKAKEKQEADLQEEVEKKEKHYQALLNRFEKTNQKRAFKTLKDEFVACGDYKDALLMVQRCDQEIEALNKAEREEKEQQEKAQKVQSARKKRRAIAVLTALLMIVGAVTYKAVIIPYKQYKEAEELFQKKQYSEAILAYEALGGYKDSRQKIEKIQSMILAETYDRAEKYYKAGDYTHAAMTFGALGDYKDARKRSFALWAGFSHRDTVVEGYGHTVAVLNDGSVISTKFSGEQKNYFGQDEVSDWKDLIAVSEGYYTTLGLCKDGTVLAVGINDNGQCDVSEWADIVEVSGGLFHSVGLRTDGTVVATKYKGAAKFNYNQCNVSEWKDVVAVSAGRAHTVALRADGTVIATGDNEFGQCNVGEWKEIIAIAAGSNHTVGLRSDGSVVSTGENKLGQCKTALWTDIVAVSASRNHTVGLKSDGTVVATGQNNCNQCDVSDWKGIVGIYAGSFLTIGIRPDGTLVTAGEEAYSHYNVSDWTEIQLPRSAEAVHLINPNYVDGETYFKSGDIAKAAIAFGKAGDYKDARERSLALWKQCTKEDIIAAGVCHTVGVTADNTVISAGTNGTEQMGADGNLIVKAFDGAGQCEVSDWTDIISVTAGNYHTLGLKSDGTVIGTGLNDDGQTSVSDWHDISAVAAGTHSVGLKSDGTVVAEGWNEYGQCEVSDWRDVVAVAAGNHTVGLKADGTVLAVGKNDVGQCEVSDWADIVAVSANTYHTVGLKADGTVVSTKITNFPEFSQHDVSDWADIVAVSAGMFHTVGLKADGTVCATGSNIFGQCNVSDWQDIVAVSAGSKHTVGLKSDGTVVAVGLTDYGQCNVSGWTDIKMPEVVPSQLSSSTAAQQSEFRIKSSLGMEVINNDLSGVVFQSVQPNSLVERAGINVGDLLLAINGVKINNLTDFNNTWGQFQEGDTIQCEVFPGGKENTISIFLESKKIGCSLSNMDHLGIVVSKVTPNGSAEKAGITVGDEIVEIDGVRVTKMSFENVLGDHKAGETVPVTYLRNEKKYTTDITFEEPTDLEYVFDISCDFPVIVEVAAGSKKPLLSVIAVGDLDTAESFTWMAEEADYGLWISIGSPEKPENTQKGLQVKTVFDESTKTYISTLWANEITEKATGKYYCTVKNVNELTLQSSTAEIQVN